MQYKQQPKGESKLDELFLTKDEVKKLTGFVRYRAQIRALKKKGFDFTVNAKGQPVLARIHVQQMLSSNTEPDNYTPNFGAIQ